MTARLDEKEYWIPKKLINPGRHDENQMALEFHSELISYAKQFLDGPPVDSENYQKMISGMAYNPGDKTLALDRFVSTDLCKEHDRVTLSDCDGDIGKLRKFRKELQKKILGRCDLSTYIETPFHVDYGYNISVGKNFYANFNLTLLDCSLIIIGDNVMVGPNVLICTAGHPTDPTSRNSGLEWARSIKIGNNVWIGGNVVVLPGVEIGCNCTVGAGSVVSKNIPPNSIACGVPCRVMKTI